MNKARYICGMGEKYIQESVRNHAGKGLLGRPMYECRDTTDWIFMK
jgi:hypothetical protein